MHNLAHSRVWRTLHLGPLRQVLAVVGTNRLRRCFSKICLHTSTAEMNNHNIVANNSFLHSSLQLRCRRRKCCPSSRARHYVEPGRSRSRLCAPELVVNKNSVFRLVLKPAGHFESVLRIQIKKTRTGLSARKLAT